MDEALRMKIREAVARGWCWKRNEHKEMDSDLASAIVDEVCMALRSLQPDAAEKHPPCVCTRPEGKTCSWPHCHFGRVTGYDFYTLDDLAAATKDKP